MKQNLNYFGSIKLFKNAKLVFNPKASQLKVKMKAVKVARNSSDFVKWRSKGKKHSNSSVFTPQVCRSPQRSRMHLATYINKNKPK